MTRPAAITTLALMSTLGAAACVPPAAPLTTWPRNQVPAGAVAHDADAMKAAFEAAHPGIEVRRLEPLQAEWSLERHPATGLPLRHIASAQLGFAYGERCYVLVENFTQELDGSDYGPTQWAGHAACVNHPMCAAAVESVRLPGDRWTPSAMPIPCPALADEAQQTADN